jgi:uncharacterized phosphosugar-binding protein
MEAMNFPRQYFQQTQSTLCRILETQMSVLERASSLVADTIQRDGIIYTLGSGHSLMVAVELYYRAGGLVNFDVLHDRTFGRAERLPGYARTLLESYPVKAADLIIVVSNSGRNCLPVELALEARQRGISTIGITSLAHSRSVTARTPQGLRLFEVCDLVIDTGVGPGDASIELAPGHPLRVGPLSTMAGIFIANCISGMTAQLLLERGFDPPVFTSANCDGADERNRPLLDFQRERIRGM